MDESLLQAYTHLKDRKLDVFEKAKLIEALKKHRHIPLKTIASHSNMKSSYLCHILRLKKLPSLIVDGYYANSISVSHLFIISRLNDEEQMIQAYEKILSDGFTVFQTEQLIREMLYQIKNEGEFLSKDERKDFSEILKKSNINAKIIQTRSRGKLVLEIRGSLQTTSSLLSKIMKTLRHFGI